MRTRDVTIPVALWICAAICAHFLFGTGGLVVAKVHDDRSELWKLSREASSLAKLGDQTFEVSLSEPATDPSEDSIPPPPKPQEAPKPPPAPAPPTPPKPAEKPKPEEKRIVVEKKKDDEKKPNVLPEDPLKDRRIAVRQHVKPDQEDNPTRKVHRRPGQPRRRRDTRDADVARPRRREADARRHAPGRATPRRATARRRASPRATSTRARRTARPASRAPTSTWSTSRRSRSRSRSPLRPRRRLRRRPRERAPTTRRRARRRATAGLAAAAGAGRRDAAVARGRELGRRRRGRSTRRARAERRARRLEATAGSGAPALPGGKMWSLPGLGQARGSGRDQHEPQPGAGRVDRRLGQPAQAARGGRRAPEERAPRVVGRVELRPLAERDRELRVEREARQPDGAQHRRRCPSPRTSTGCTTASTRSSPRGSSGRSTACRRRTR